MVAISAPVAAPVPVRVPDAAAGSAPAAVFAGTVLLSLAVPLFALFFALFLALSLCLFTRGAACVSFGFALLLGLFAFLLELLPLFPGNLAFGLLDGSFEPGKFFALLLPCLPSGEGVLVVFFVGLGAAGLLCCRGLVSDVFAPDLPDALLYRVLGD